MIETDKKIESGKLKSNEQEIKSVNFQFLTLSKVYENVERNFPIIISTLKNSKFIEYTDGIDQNDGISLYDSSNADIQRFNLSIKSPVSFYETSFFSKARLGKKSLKFYFKETKESYYTRNYNLKQALHLENNKVKLEIQKTETKKKFADLSIAQQKILAYKNAILCYWDWVSGIEKYKIYKSLYDITFERREYLEKKVNEGHLAIIEKIDNDQALLQREEQLLNLKKQMIIASNDLSIFMQKEEGKIQTLSSELIPKNPYTQIPELNKLDISRAIEKALEKRPEFLRLNVRKDNNKVEQEHSKNKSPIATGSTTNQKLVVDNSPADKNKINDNIKNAYALLETLSDSIDTLRREVDLARKFEKKEMDKFLSGETSLIFINICEQATARNCSREIEAMTDYSKAFTQFQSAILEQQFLSNSR